MFLAAQADRRSMQLCGEVWDGGQDVAALLDSAAMLLPRCSFEHKWSMHMDSLLLLQKKVVKHAQINNRGRGSRQ